MWNISPTTHHLRSRSWNTKRPPLSPFFWPKSIHSGYFLKYIDINKFFLSAFRRDFKHQTRIGFIEWYQKILVKFKRNCKNWLNLMKKRIKNQKIHCAKIWRHPVDIEQQHLESREDWQLPNLLHAPTKTDMNLNYFRGRDRIFGLWNSSYFRCWINCSLDATMNSEIRFSI